ncbi:RloB family protein [Hydrogenophaga crassostreae]|uniref:RloB family protein n=1 Tax=Hydrogenophaga crassostreae TaxID=1763535 RepID=UPI0009EF1953|nr:RloB family protein [Hydrogenophaga crassostreae]
MQRIPSAPSISRRSKIIAPKVEIVVACEGKVTEREYLESCKQEYGSGLVALRFLPITGVPITVVNAAIEERERLLLEQRRSRNSFDVFRVWAVFDRDEHPRVNEAIELAKSNRIDIAFSNPCFEIWPLLHLINYGGQDDRHRIQRRLRALMPQYDHENGAVIDFDLVKDKVDDAFNRSKSLLLQRETEGIPLGCPSTTVGILVRKIIENGRGRFSRHNNNS